MRLLAVRLLILLGFLASFPAYAGTISIGGFSQNSYFAIDPPNGLAWNWDNVNGVIMTFTVPVTSNGTLWAWGDNGYGQLGDGTTVAKSSPVLIGTGFASVKSGSVYIFPNGDQYYTVAFKTDGSLWAWGANAYGQLGDGTTTNQLSPVKIGTGYTGVLPAGYNTFVRKTDGSWWGWGANNYWQLGDGTTTPHLTPVLIGTNLLDLWGGLDYACVIKSDRTLWCWGANYNGQVGDGTAINRPNPVQIGTGFKHSDINNAA